MSLLPNLFQRTGASGFGRSSTAEEVTHGLDLSGKTALITGSNSGLGKETARVLSLRGAHVLCAARSREKADAAAQSMRDGQGVVCELSELSSVRQCVESVREIGKPLDYLICNAGIMALPKLEQKAGYELQFYTNHIGHFALVTGLLDQLSERARVVVLSSYGHRLATGGIQFDNLSGERGRYSSWRTYGQSKLANLLFSNELARRFQGSKRTSNALHPGVIRTQLSRHMNPVIDKLYEATQGLYTKSIPQGAATTCYVATHPSLEGVSGKYFADCNQKEPSKHGQDAPAAKRLWEISEQIVASAD